MKRRDALRALLATPALALACEEDPPRPIAGELKGPDWQRGHRLRETPLPSVVREPEPVRVVIVGGGVAGLSAAWWLRRRGVDDVVVLELEDAPGGTSRWSSTEVTPYPWGAHYLPVPSPRRPALAPLRALLEEMGALEDGEPAEHVCVREPEERVFHRGFWYPGLYPYANASAEDLAQLARFEEEIARAAALVDGGGKRAFTLPFAACSMDADLLELDGESAEVWLDRKGFTSKRLRWLCDYACRDDFGLGLGQTSAWAHLFYWASRVDDPGDQSAPILTWPNGNGALVAHLHRASANRVHTGSMATRVEAGPDGVRVETDDHHVYQAERCILAVPRFVAARLVDVPSDEPYGSWAVANLHLQSRPSSRGAPMAWDSVIHESPSLGYVCATHQRGRDHGPTVLTWYFAMTTDDPDEARRRLLDARFEDWRDLVLADLRPAHPNLEAIAERVDVWRWGHAMVQPRPGFLRGGRRHERWRPRGRLHFAHTDLSGMALFEEAFTHGVRAANEVLSA